MKSMQFETLSQLFPHLVSKSLKDLYQSTFEPQHLLRYFEGWEFYESYNRYIDTSENRNMVWFNEHTYCINGTELKWPATLDDFINDCRSQEVDLIWSPLIQEKI